MEECSVRPASTELRNLLPVYLLLTPPLVGVAPSSTLLLRAKTQQTSVSTLFPSPHPIYQSPCPLPLSLTHLLLFLGPHCHPSPLFRPPSMPAWPAAVASHRYPYLRPCSFPLRLHSQLLCSRSLWAVALTCTGGWGAGQWPTKHFVVFLWMRSD